MLSKRKFAKKLWISLLMLLLLLVMPMATSAEPETAQPPQPTLEQTIQEKYSIDPQRKYDGSSVIRAIAVILREAEAERAEYGKTMWDSGYKQGVLDWRPVAEGAQAQVAALNVSLSRNAELWAQDQAKLARQKDISLGVGIAGVTLSLLSFGAGFFVGVK